VSGAGSAENHTLTVNVPKKRNLATKVSIAAETMNGGLVAPLALASVLVEVHGCQCGGEAGWVGSGGTVSPVKHRSGTRGLPWPPTRQGRTRATKPRLSLHRYCAGYRAIAIAR